MGSDVQECINCDSSGVNYHCIVSVTCSYVSAVGATGMQTMGSNHRGRYTLPVFTARENGCQFGQPRIRTVSTARVGNPCYCIAIGIATDLDGPCSRVSKNCARVHGP